MPQLIELFFVNQFVWSFIGLISITYILGTYVLPMFSFTNISRLYITKL